MSTLELSTNDNASTPNDHHIIIPLIQNVICICTYMYHFSRNVWRITIIDGLPRRSRKDTIIMLTLPFCSFYTFIAFTV